MRAASPLVHLVADYGAGDLAFSEVTQRLLGQLPGATVVTMPVGAFDTLAAGFCVAQLALNPGPEGRVVLHNVAPRADRHGPRPGNRGERLLAGRTEEGTLVVGPDAGHVFSFVRDELVGLREVPIPPEGSQFRSRDVFPERLAALVTGDDGQGESVDPDDVPLPPERVVVYVDGYGNLKTDWSHPPAASGEHVHVRVGGGVGRATVSDGTFEVAEGELSFAPGSSGWPLRAGGHRRFYELFLRGGSAARQFQQPATGAVVEIEAGT